MTVSNHPLSKRPLGSCVDLKSSRVISAVAANLLLSSQTVDPCCTYLEKKNMTCLLTIYLISSYIFKPCMVSTFIILMVYTTSMLTSAPGHFPNLNLLIIINIICLKFKLKIYPPSQRLSWRTVIYFLNTCPGIPSMKLLIRMLKIGKNCVTLGLSPTCLNYSRALHLKKNTLPAAGC